MRGSCRHSELYVGNFQYHKCSRLAPRRDSNYLDGVTRHQRKISAIIPKLLGWFLENARDLPWRGQVVNLVASAV